MILTGGYDVAFGDRIEYLEKIFSIQATDNPSRVARHPQDKIIETKNVCFEFDNGRLRTIRFKDHYVFERDLTPYPESEAWKNFPVLGFKRIFRKMHRDEFVAYVGKWQARAASLGAQRIDGNNIASTEYDISIHIDQFLNSIHISMGPSRRAGGGEIWCDGWTAFFAHKRDGRLLPQDECVLESLSVFRDEFNTVARRPTE